jgi:hypothetical protein
MEVYTRWSVKALCLLIGDIKGYQSEFISLICLGYGIASFGFGSSQKQIHCGNV